MEGSADPSIKITPSNGVVPAGATQWIKVELNTDRSRQIDENILLDNASNENIFNQQLTLVLFSMESLQQTFTLSLLPLTLLV